MVVRFATFLPYIPVTWDFVGLALGFCAVTYGYAREISRPKRPHAHPPVGWNNSHQSLRYTPSSALGPFPVTISTVKCNVQQHSLFQLQSKGASFRHSFHQRKSLRHVAIYFTASTARVKMKSAFHGIYRPTKYTVED